MTTGTGCPGRRPIFGHVHFIMDTGSSIKILTRAVYFIFSHHRSHLPGIHLYTPCSYDVTQEGDGVAMEFALLRFHNKLVLQEALENLGPSRRR